ncbi:MAG: ATP-binding protein [Deltaproteobacteria bacterium]|nr:ATP-binding protein [Deltaproteobacteria bacterium]
MVIRRKIESELRRWKSAKNRKPIILRGARQVGKTYTINRFSENFEQFIELNLERPRERELFTDFNTGKELFERILLYKGTHLKKNHTDTLLFIDEIQNSAEAIKALRYFREDLSDLAVIAAGSLLEVFSKQEGFSFPVGRVKNLYLYPVNFLEYLETANSPLAQKLSNMDIIGETALHDLLMAQFHEYAFLGGMPEALAVYLKSGSYSELRSIYDEIFLGYIEDVEKYSNIAKAKYLTHTIDRAPLYAGERITYEKFGESSYRSREIKEAFDVLERALIVHRARPSTSTRIPVIEKMRKAPKLFFLDAGLMNYRIGLKEFFSDRQSLDTAYRGRISEQIVAQEIVSQTHLPPALHFWIREKGSAEIDFLYSFKEFVIPVEVKSGKTGTLRSLNLFMEKSAHPYAVRIYSGKARIDPIQLPSGRKFYLFSMPYYLISEFNDALDQFIQICKTHQS